MKLALLITSFNRPDALDLVLKSVACQAHMPDDVIVCDDGSRRKTRDVLNRWQGELPVRYAWQPDSDFRAARIRNLGISMTEAEYLIWIDGDCLLSSKFVERHLGLAKPGFVVAGGRYMLADGLTQSLLTDEVPFNSAFTSWKFWNWPVGLLRDAKPTAWRTVRTCNMGFYRNDCLAVGGFDESFVGWGLEDSDFVVRLIRSGIKIRSGRLATCVAHLYHPPRSRDQLSLNEKRFLKTLDSNDHLLARSSILAP